MNVISNDAVLTEVFSAIYGDLVTRQPAHLSIVYQSFGTIWNLALQGDPHSVNIGETFRGQEKLFYVQPRKPQGPGQVACQKFAYRADETAKMSYLTVYYLLAVRGPVNMADLNAHYPDLSSEERRQLWGAIETMDKYIHA